MCSSRLPPSEVTDELAVKALRSSLWLSLYHAQQVGLGDIVSQLTAMMMEIDKETDTPASRACSGVRDNSVGSGMATRESLEALRG
jgi:hypothetical protein